MRKFKLGCYKLPPELGVSPTFNISDLKPYLGEEDELESRTTPIQEGEDDEHITPLDTNNIQGLVTRARARELNLEVSSFLNTSLYDYKDRLLANDYIVIRNHGEGEEMLGDGLGGVQDQLGRTSQEGGPKQFGLGSVSRSRSSLH